MLDARELLSGHATLLDLLLVLVGQVSLAELLSTLLPAVHRRRLLRRRGRRTVERLELLFVVVVCVRVPYLVFLRSSGLELISGRLEELFLHASKLLGGHATLLHLALFLLPRLQE